MTLTFDVTSELVQEQHRAVTPLRDLLLSYGAATSREALAHECEHDLSLLNMAKCIERRGLRARVVSVLRADLPNLGVTLVELRDRTIALLRPDGRSCRLELPDGSVLRGSRQVAAALGDKALEIEGRWPTFGSFLQRTLRICLTDPRVRSALVLALVTLCLSEVAALVQPLLARSIVDRAIPEVATRLLALLVAALIGGALLAALVANLSERGELYAEKRLAAAMYPGIFGHYLRLPFAELSKHTVGGALQILKSAPTVVHALVHHVAAGALDLLLTAGYLYWIVDLAPSLALMLVVAHVLTALVVVPLAQRAARLNDAVLLRSGVQSDHLLELIDRVAPLRVEGAFDWALTRWKQALRATQEQELRLELTNGTVTELVGATQRLVIGVTVLWAAHACLVDARTLGELFAVVAASTAASGALVRLTTLGSSLLTTRAQLRRLDEVLSEPCEVEAKVQGDGPRPEAGIVVDGAWFRYEDDGPWVVQNLSLSFEARKVHTIRWPSGHGKSTLLRLIAGLLTPQKGAITVNGLDAGAARPLVAYVPQSCVLFAGSIAYNLRLLSGASSERIEAAVAATGLKRVLEQWPMGTETIVTDGGGNLSSGQRQLVIFTAALASRRPILLLDEATTHLDLAMRAGLEKSWLLDGRTIVNVMHFDG